MPWSLERRDGEWCVVKQGESSPVPGGCHSSRADAIKHQRALYANESRMASLYTELDARPDPEPEPAAPPALAASSLSPLAAELVGLLLKDEREKSLVASMAESQSLIALQMQEAQQDRQALVAALERMGPSVINVPPSEVTVNVPPAEVSVNVPAAEVTVNVPDVNVTVDAPQVTVRPTINMPRTPQKTVTFERDPLTQQVTKAEVTEA